MKSSGYTLIELLIVISIISLLSTIGFISFKSFSSNQVAIKAAGEIQTVLRLAQSNATSSTLCDSQGAVSWSVEFVNATTLKLRCDPGDHLKNTYLLENAQIGSIAGSSCGGLPFTLTYSTGTGALSFFSSTATSGCLASTSWIFTIENSSDTSKTKIFTISKGGAIDVQ